MDLAEQIHQLEEDLQELGSLLEKAARKRAQELLRQEQSKVKNEIVAKRQQKEKQARREADPTTASVYTLKISNYGWCQSDKYVEIFVTLKGVHEVPSENVEVKFTESSFSVLVKGLDGKNHQMTVMNLLCPIDPKDSFKKIKTDKVLVLCKKQTVKENWDCLTQFEKQSKEKKEAKPAVDENADPGSAIMNIIQKMYSEGDDDMKRTINKAMAESQEKRRRGEDTMDL